MSFLKTPWESSGVNRLGFHQDPHGLHSIGVGGENDSH
jgi:hypothetical protein